MPKDTSKSRKSRKNVSNKNQLNNSSLIDFDKLSNEYYFSTQLNWEMFYNIQHKELLNNIICDIETIKLKNNRINKNINKVIQDDNINNITSNHTSNHIRLEDVRRLEDLKTIRNHFINLESLARQKFLKIKTK